MNFTAQDVESMIASQRNFYFTGETRSAAFRIAMLSKLKEAILLNEEAQFRKHFIKTCEKVHLNPI